MVVSLFPGFTCSTNLTHQRDLGLSIVRTCTLLPLFCTDVYIFLLHRILQLRQKISPTETQQVRMHSRIVREAFDEIDELEHFEPEREQWISTWDAELDSSWLQSSETRTSTSRTPHSRTSIKAASDPSHC